MNYHWANNCKSVCLQLSARVESRLLAFRQSQDVRYSLLLTLRDAQIGPAP